MKEKEVYTNSIVNCKVLLQEKEGIEQLTSWLGGVMA